MNKHELTDEEILDKFKKLSKFLKTLINSKKDLFSVAGALWLAYEAIKEELDK